MIITVTLNPAIDKALRVPGFAVGEHAKAEVLSLLPAGKGVNVARGLARLGSAALATGFVGRNEEGMFAESLAKEGAQARFCRVSGRTRTNTTILDPDARATTHLREPGFRVQPDDVGALRSLLTGLLDEHPDAPVVFAGSLPEGVGQGGFAALLRLCAGQGARVVVDTSGPALRAAVRSGAVSTIKPNLLELGECLGREVPQEKAVQGAQQLLASVQVVLLTLGEQGAYLVHREGELGRHCPLEPGELANVVGCGDAFLAGWLHGLDRNAPLEQALQWAVASGAASATSESTVGYSRADVERLLPRCLPLT